MEEHILIINKLMEAFVIFYPLIMSIIWFLGGVISRFSKYKISDFDKNIEKNSPLVSILLAAHNEEELIENTLRKLNKVNYPNFEVIVIDDGSVDRTVEIVNKVQKEFDIELIELVKNQGKAHALNIGYERSKGEYILVVDADSYIDKHAVKYLLKEFQLDSHMGAVTGRPIVKNKRKLLTKFQSIEYLSIIDNIKRTQQYFLNCIQTVSGVIVMYRKSALEDVDGFDENVMTEDINITWDLYRKNWKVGYAPRAYTYIFVPESLKGLIKQRTRWAIGGLENFNKNKIFFIKNLNFKKCILLFEFSLGHLWAWSLIYSYIVFIYCIYLNEDLSLSSNIIIAYMIISFISIIISILITEEKDEHTLLKFLPIFSVYVMFYWMIILVTSLKAQFIFFLGVTGKGKWEKSDRGDLQDA